MAEEKFDYTAAVAELERIAAKVEDPSTAIGEIGALMERSNALVKACRDYLRGAETALEALAE